MHQQVHPACLPSDCILYVLGPRPTRAACLRFGQLTGTERSQHGKRQLPGDQLRSCATAYIATRDRGRWLQALQLGSCRERLAPAGEDTDLSDAQTSCRKKAPASVAAQHSTLLEVMPRQGSLSLRREGAVAAALTVKGSRAPGLVIGGDMLVVAGGNKHIGL